MCLGPGGARDFRAKTRKRQGKRENAKTDKEVPKRESGTATFQIPTGSKVPAWKFSGVEICNGT